MNRLKEFWQDHKVAICVVGGTVVLTAAAYLLLKQKTKIVDLTGKSVISWKPDGKSFNLEQVKAFLEANKDGSGMFAIFREGLNPDEYAIIGLNGSLLH